MQGTNKETSKGTSKEQANYHDRTDQCIEILRGAAGAEKHQHLLRGRQGEPHHRAVRLRQDRDDEEPHRAARSGRGRNPL